MRNKNILIAQGGGPTMVINQSLIGLLINAKRSGFNVYGSLNGVRGIVNNNFVKLNKISEEKSELIANTPSSILGSTRDKPDTKYCEEILKVLKQKKIDSFFYIGGNDSSDSLRIISEKAKIDYYELQCVHIPKTIDNDLVRNDHTPGFGSAAKYVAMAFSGINLDVRSLPGVYIGVVMGRHAGFLAASSALLKKKEGDGPHLIYTPEIDFNIKKFFKDIKNIYDKYGRCIIAVSEGIQDKKRRLIANYATDLSEKDSHGNVQLSGTGSLGDYLVNQIKKNLKISRVRADTFGYMQRSFLGCSSEVDKKEAMLIGKKAFDYSLNSKQSFSVSIIPRNKFSLPYSIKYGTNSLSDIAAKTKYLDKKFINKNQNFITQSFIKYAKPLIGNEIPKFVTSLK